MNNTPKLTELEIVIMETIWDNNRSMTIQEISDCLKERKVSVASVSQVMRRLLKKKAVVVSEHILVSNVYARTFQACISREQFVSARIRELESNMSSVGMAAAILKYASEDERVERKEIEELQKLIEEKKRKIQ